MRRLAAIVALIGAAGVLAVLGTGASAGSAGGPYVVRAIFDDAAFAVPGEQVRIAGAPVGTVQSLDVTPAKKAAVTLEIADARFAPFYGNATCAIRPQSLIGEKYVDCDPGTADSSRLGRIARGPGAGTYLLPVTRTRSPVDSDIVQNIYRQPVREQLAVLISELGTGLAARGSDLNEVIHRANPALGYTDQVFQILARQNRGLARLATDADTVLGPLAQVRRSIADFIVQARQTSDASAARSADISRSFARLPDFLRQLRPLMADLGVLADQGTPLLADLGNAAPALGRAFTNLAPFATASRPALVQLGAAAAQSQPALQRTLPLAEQLSRLGNQGAPAAASLDRLTASFDQTGGIERLMDFLFYATTAANGFDSVSHYVRTQVLVGSCTAYLTSPLPGCSANFRHASAAADTGGSGSAPHAPSTARSGPAAASPARLAEEAVRALKAAAPAPDSALRGLLGYLIKAGR
jgi:ABC-type transporter Mla subunit MlaD